MIRRAVLCLLLIRFAACSPDPATAQYMPPRPPRLARSLSGDQIARIVTNASPSAKISVPFHGLRAWRPGLDIRPGDAVSHGGSIYICVQRHVPQSDWAPPIVPALWRLVRTPTDGAIPSWRQPFGAHDAYALGDRVMHLGRKWESTIAANVWPPGVYGWNRLD